MLELNRLFTQSFDFANNTIFFPVRHHSPACAFHLLKTISLYKPETILIEAPADCNHLINYITDDATKPPFCIYTAYNDKKGQISEEDERYRAYYPFLEYSPEYAALKEAARINIPAYFIDLAYGSYLMNSENTKESSYYEDDKRYSINQYTAMLTQKSGCRDFNEFWEKEFELSAFDKPTCDFVKNVFALGYYMRMAEGTIQEDNDATIQREYFMARKIKNAQERFKKIIVVTGSFHTIGLLSQLQDDSKIEIKQHEQDFASSYLMPYTFEGADKRSGYSAGIPFPAFYQKVWQEREKGSEKAHRQALLTFIIKGGRYARQSHNTTLPDEINALYMASSLAKMRDKKTCGVYELLDGVRSSFIKGHAGLSNTEHIGFMVSLLSGLGVGQVVAGDCVPPVVENFRALCKRYKIKTSTVMRQEAVLDIVKNYSHNLKSRFMHQLLYLDLGFCKLSSGPDYVNRRNKNLAREIWEYRYSVNIESKLIDISVYGATIEEVCCNILNKNLKDCSTAESISKDMISAQVMGINDFIDVNSARIEQVIAADRNFQSLCICLNNLSYLENIRVLTDTLLPSSETDNKNIDDFVPEQLSKSDSDIAPFASSASYFAIYEIENIKNTATEDEFEIGSGLKNLYSFTKERPEWFDNELFHEIISKTISDTFCNSHIYGIAIAIAYKDNIIDIKEFSNRIGVYLAGCSDDGAQASSFISGVLLIARDIVFTTDTILNQIDDIIKPLSNSDFIAILPNLRYAFTSFLPSELVRIASIIAGKYSGNVSDITSSFDVSAQELKKSMQADSNALEQMKKWGLAR